MFFCDIADKDYGKGIGVTQMMLAIGVFMVSMAIALGVTGTVLLKLARE